MVSKKELQDRLDAALTWAVEEFDAWAMSLVKLFPEEEEVEEAASYVFEELPEILGEYVEGSMIHGIIAYRLKEGITDSESDEFWWETPPFQARLRHWIEEVLEYGDEHISDVKCAIFRMRELYGLITILTDADHIIKHVEQWCFEGLDL